LIISTLFSVLPLVNIRFIAPLIILRETVKKQHGRKSKFRYFHIHSDLPFPMDILRKPNREPGQWQYVFWGACAGIRIVMVGGQGIDLG
jgi:hypothetical protein